MAREDTPEFRFDGNEEEPESFYQEELKDLRVEKLSQRVTLLTILLPSLIALAIYFGYQNLSDRVSQGHDTGSLEIQRLTKELDDLSKNFNEKLITFSTTLSTQDKDIGTTIEGRLFAINKDIGELQENFKSLNEELKRDLKQNQDTIEKLMASKADQKSQAVAVEKINASITSLKKELEQSKALGQDLKTVSGEIKNLESRFSKKLEAATANTEQFGKNYAQLEASLTKLSGKTIDKDALALELLKLRINFESQLTEAGSGLNKRLESLQTQIDAVEKISGTQKQALNKTSPKAASQQSGAAPATGAGSAAPPAQPRTITEKDLIE